jgi:hypothetical protein
LTRKVSAVLDAAYIGNWPHSKGFCTHCGKLATKAVHFSDDGVVIVERYCEECIEPENFSRLQAWYSKF